MDLNLTYEELGERLGITRNAARVLAQRRKWHRYTSQDDGKARVRVPAEAITDLTNRRATARAEHVLPPEPPAVRPDGDGVRPAVLPDSRLADMLGLLLDRVTADEAARRDEVARLRQDQERLAEERDRLRDELQEVRAEADHAKADQVRMARDVATMFDELRTLTEKHAELHADRARLEAELERARQDADRQRADHAAELERVRDELDRVRQDAGLWREETDRERARIVNLQADAEHTERELARLKAELEQARRPWWRRVVGR
jgi:hypothetical protein